jgi:DNA-binding XRE family transcriptional regulator
MEESKVAGAPAKSKESLAERTAVAKQFKVFRKRNLLSQMKLAGLLGVHKDTISLVERRQVYPSYDTLGKFKVLKQQYDKEK